MFNGAVMPPEIAIERGIHANGACWLDGKKALNIDVAKVGDAFASKYGPAIVDQIHWDCDSDGNPFRFAFVRTPAGRRRKLLPETPAPAQDASSTRTGAPKYPIAALGDTIIGQAARELAKHGQIDAAIIGQTLLATAALSVQGGADVRTVAGTKPLSIFALTLAVSVDGKSTSDKAATASVRKLQCEEYGRYEAERTAWLATAKSARGAPPINPTILVSDFTAEGLIRQFREGRPSLGAFNDEAGAVLAGHSFKAEAKLATAAGLSSLWDGSGIQGRARASDDRGGLEFIAHCRLAAHWLIQPTAAADALNDPILQDQGFWPRVLLACPAPGKPREFKPFDPDSLKALAAFRRQVLGRIQTPYLTENRPTITCDDGATAEIKAFFEMMEHEGRLKAGKYFGLRAWAGRSTEHVYRVAGVLTAFERGFDAQIDTATAKDAIQLVKYSMDSWLHTLDQAPADEVAAYADRLFTWLKKQPGQQSTGTAMLVTGPKPRSQSRRDAALAYLHGSKKITQVATNTWKVAV